jgi:hypothetical protein
MKNQKRKRSQPGRAPILPADIVPPVSSSQPLPPPEISPNGSSAFDFPPETMLGKGRAINGYEALLILLKDPQRVDSAERLILAITGPSAVVVGSMSGVLIFATHYRDAGMFGLASTVVAGIVTIVVKVKRQKRSRSGS